MSIRTCVFSFPDVNLNKYQWIFARLGMCIDIVEIWFEIANGQILSILKELPARDIPVFSFPDDNLSKCLWIFTKLCMCIDIVEIWFGIANGQILSIFDGVICQRHAHMPHDSSGYYGFTLVVCVSVCYLSVCHMSIRTCVFSFPDVNLNKYQCIFAKLCMCIDIVEIWFGIANGQILSIFDGVICQRHAHIFVSKQ